MSIKKPIENQLNKQFPVARKRETFRLLWEYGCEIGLFRTYKNVDGLSCEPASPKAVRGLSGPSRYNLGTLMGEQLEILYAKNLIQVCIRCRRGTASFGNQIR